ncbi:CheR family methyltransferase [Sphingomonas canadensis]|uniref:protein-glutamate O-methyltransferase n=1 Tax=Sphingomonas canadensis TaxID=1219257 RepID=A0ABW3H1U7_9SPHN|nr:CheR family methyltransferase [Sphingomonas canadensis]MCW3834737.1 methyltransferase domain-containing protein [Sphingomonas canadensis]
MSAVAAAPDIERFRRAVRRWIGLDFDTGRSGGLAGVLARRMRASGLAEAAYLAWLEGAPGAAELRALAQELTVTETSFFRHPGQIQAFAEIVLPDRARAAAAEGRALSILSAGCASGEEPYTLAACARESPALAGRAIGILGIDVNPAMLRKAEAGRYSEWSLRQTPPELRNQLFRRDGGDSVLIPAVRRLVGFEERNLVADDPAFWATGRFDVIFCRNVLMYFPPATARAVVARMAQSLAPGGYLFLGYAETLRGLTTGFQICHTGDAFYYRLKDGARLPPPPDAPFRQPYPLPSAEAPAAAVPHLVSDAPPPPGRPLKRPARRPAPQPARGWDGLHAAAELLAHERFDDAATVLGGLTADQARAPEALLLAAILQTHGGNIPAAERICAELLALDDFNAGAHHLLALCHENRGDPEGAARHDRIAAYIDPGFAMPRLHLGLLARRAGRIDEARANLEQALLLLDGEDGVRFHLFAGGFGRAALTALCSAELAACGAPR